jgi:hypothetical protein
VVGVGYLAAGYAVEGWQEDEAAEGVLFYVPPRWRAERSMNGKRGLLEWCDGEVDGELEDADDGDEVVKDGRHVSSYNDVASGDTAEVAVASSSEDSQPSDSSEENFDILLDLDSGAVKSDWEVVSLTSY